MKNQKIRLFKKAVSFFIFISSVLNFTSSFAQQSLVNINGWNAYVHLPWDYYSNPNATYPTIIFFPGTGEVGTNASLVIKYGPGANIAQGWNGNVKIGTDSVKFIVISLQPSALWPIETYIDTRIQTLKKMYRIDTKRLHLTGLSMGGWCGTTYVTADNYGGPYNYASQVATVVEVEGVRPDDNQPYPNLFDNFAKSGGRLLGFEQINDGRDTKTRVDRMNYTRANSAIFVPTSYGTGAHCCYDQFYGGNGTTAGKFILDGINQNMYEWMARNPAPTASPYTNISPVANAGADKSITLPANSVSLTGSGSDPDGTIASYLWKKISGPSSFTISNSTSSSTTVTSLVQGVYLFELKVTDNSGAIARDTMKITVNTGSNMPPVANAGPDKSITLPINYTTLAGSGTDPDGSIVNYKWTEISGPSSGNIVNPTSASANIQNLVAGVYQFELLVTDNSGATGRDTMQITMWSGSTSQLPVANAGPDKSINLPVNTITLSGVGTSATGTITGYSWRQIAGPSTASIVTESSPATVVNNLIAGTYQFQFRVADNAHNIAADTVQVTVKASANITPVANAGSDITITSPASSVTLYGSGTDADGSIASYSWAQTSGASAKILSSNAATTSVTNLISSGTYTFTLTVTDNNGATGVDNVVVTVNPAAAIPPPVSSGKRKMIPIAADGGIYFFNNNYLQPGDTGCIQAGTYPYISLSGIVGTASQPITITNCGGQVINTGNNGQSYCYRIVNSRFFKFTGTGAPGINYGFKAYWKGGFTGVGISVKDSTSDYEIDHFEAQNVQNGFLCKIDPYNCDPGTWSTGWTIKNISFHDNYVHNTTGEGYYIINTSSTVTVNDCTGKAITVEPVKASGVKVYNNICDSTGWDGIQVAASANAEIYNNRVTNYGRSNLASQQAGIILGGKSNGSVYNNYINNGTGEGLEIFGTGDVYIYNNVISNAGWDGTSSKQDAIAVDDRPQPYNWYAGLRVYVINNTIVNAARNAIHLFNSYGTMAGGNRVNNNLLVKPNNTSPYDNPYVNVDGNTSVDTTKNTRLSVISSAGFVNSGLNDYHIVSTSPAIDKGLDATSYGVTKDYDGISRPQGPAYDAGAFEYNKGTQPAPPPSAYTNAIHVNIYDGKIPYNNSQWNNWNVNSSLSSGNLLYDDNSSSSVNASLNSNSGIVNNGSNYAPGATSCPPPVLQLNTISKIDRYLIINGLDNTKQYRVELYAARANLVNATRFIVGNLSDTITILNNVNDFAKFDNVSPTNGKITVTIKALIDWQYLAGFSILEQGGNAPIGTTINPGLTTQAEQAANSVSSNNPETVTDKTLDADFVSLQNNILTLKMNSGKQQVMNVSVVDASGRTLMSTNVTLQKGYNTFNKFIPQATKGIYYIKFLTTNNFVVKPVMSGIK